MNKDERVCFIADGYEWQRGAVSSTKAAYKKKTEFCFGNRLSILFKKKTQLHSNYINFIYCIPLMTTLIKE